MICGTKMSRYLTVSMVFLLFASLCSGCTGKNPEHQVSLAWEATIPSSSASVHISDTGEADVRPVKVGDVAPPVVHFNGRGQPVAEFDAAVFDDTGKALSNLDGLSRVQRSVSTDRIIAIANESWTTDTKCACVIDLADGKLEVSRARIPSFAGFALSPSGEFLALVEPVSESECIVSVYRLDGVD